MWKGRVQAAPGRMNAALRRTSPPAKGIGRREFPGRARWLIAPPHRAPFMAFYHFACAAGDVGDHPTASAEDRLAGLATMRAELDSAGAAEAKTLREVMAAHGIDPVHANDLLRCLPPRCAGQPASLPTGRA